MSVTHGIHQRHADDFSPRCKPFEFDIRPSNITKPLLRNTARLCHPRSDNSFLQEESATTRRKDPSYRQAMTSYVSNGRIRRRESKRGVQTGFLRYFSWTRAAIVLALTTTLGVSNPANWKYLPLGMENKLPNVFPAAKDAAKRTATNYFFFSIQRSFDSAKFWLFGQPLLCNYSDYNYGDFCVYVGADMAHGKPLVWDETDLPYSFYRVICWILILSAIITFCCPMAPFHRLFTNPYLDALCSIFYRPSLLVDIAEANACLYPALVELHHILPQLHRGSMFSTGNLDRDFYLSASLLVFGIGGGCNFLATKCAGRSHTVFGFSAVAAASLTYCHRTTSTRTRLMTFLSGLVGETYISPGEIFWSKLLFSVATNLIVGTNSAHWFPSVVAWLAAGWFGSMLAMYHLQDLTFFGDFFRHFRF